MPRQRKENHPFTMKMDINIYHQLEDFCKESGLSKTSAIERALTLYMQEYREERKVIEKHNSRKKS